MAKIPVYTATQDLDTAARSMPRVSVDTSAFSAMAQAGNALSQLGARYGELQARQEAFGLRSQESAWLEQFAREDDEAVRNIPVNGAGYTENRAKAFDERAQEFIGKLPDHARTEYSARIGQQRDRYLRKWAGTEAAQAGKYSISEIEKFSTTARQSIFNNPDDLDNQVREARERITLAPGLTTDQRTQLFKQVDENFRAIVAQRIAGDNPEEMARLMGVRLALPASSTRAGAAGGGSFREIAEGVTSRIIGIESGGNPNAKNPKSTATGAGQFINSTWLSMIRQHKPDIAAGKTDAEILALRTDGALSREMTTKYAEVNAKALSDAGLPVNPATIYLAHFLGSGGAKRILSAPTGNEPVAEIVGGPAVRANPSILGGGKTAADVIAWASRKMGEKPSGGAGPSLKADPRFEALPFETRVQLVREASVTQERQLRQQAEAQRAEFSAFEQQRRTVYEGLKFDADEGKVGRAEADKLRDEGFFKDFSEYKQLRDIIERSEGRTAERDAAYARFGSNGLWLAGDATHKAQLDAVYKAEKILDGVQNRDGGATDRMVQMFSQSGMLPDDAKRGLESMVRNGTKQQQVHALQAMDRMARSNPSAFEDQIGDDNKRLLTAWQNDPDKATFYDRQKEWMDPRNRKVREEMQKEAVKTHEQTFTDAHIVKVFDERGLISIPFTGPNAPLTPTDMARLRMEHREHFSYAFAGEARGNAKAATEYANKKIKDRWAMSPSAGNRIVEMAPETLPESIFPTVGGKRDWLAEQVKGALAQVAGDEQRAAGVDFDLGSLPGAGRMVKAQKGSDSFSYTLMADPGGRTEAEITTLRMGGQLPDGRKSPVWLLAWEDPDTGLIKSRPFFFDVDVALKQRTEVDGKNAARSDNQRLIEQERRDFGLGALGVP